MKRHTGGISQPGSKVGGDLEDSDGGSANDVPSEKLNTIDMHTEENGKSGCCGSGFCCFGTHKPNLSSAKSQPPEKPQG